MGIADNERVSSVLRYCGEADPPWVRANLRSYRRGDLQRLGVGDLVAVARRCGPGDNYPGGAAMITASYPGCFYDVKYITGGTEKKVDGCFCSMISFDDRRTKKRSRGPGRCLNCGSFILDCGGKDCGNEFQAAGKDRRSGNDNAPHAAIASTKVKSKQKGEKLKPSVVYEDQLSTLAHDVSDHITTSKNVTAIQESSPIESLPAAAAPENGASVNGNGVLEGENEQSEPASHNAPRNSLETGSKNEYSSQTIQIGLEVGATAEDEDGIRQTDPQGHFFVGQVVFVKNRQSPGINKEGGVGRISAVNASEGTYDVVYHILGGTERGLEPEYIQPYDLEGRRARHTLGRCRVCSSLIVHCNHLQPPWSSGGDPRESRAESSSSSDSATNGSDDDEQSESSVVIDLDTGTEEASGGPTSRSKRPRRRRRRYALVDDDESSNSDGSLAPTQQQQPFSSLARYAAPSQRSNTLSGSSLGADQETSFGDSEGTVRNDYDRSDSESEMGATFVNSESDPSENEESQDQDMADFIVDEGDEAAQELPDDITNPLNDIKGDTKKLERELTRLLRWLSEEGLPTLESGIRRVRKGINLLRNFSNSGPTAFELGQELQMLEDYALQRVTRRGVDIANWCWRQLDGMESGIPARLELAAMQLSSFESRLSQSNGQLKGLKRKYSKVMESLVADDGGSNGSQLIANKASSNRIQEETATARAKFKPFYVRFEEKRCRNRRRHKETSKPAFKAGKKKRKFSHTARETNITSTSARDNTADSCNEDFVAVSRPPDVEGDGRSARGVPAIEDSSLVAGGRMNKKTLSIRRKRLVSSDERLQYADRGLGSLVDDLRNLPRLPSHTALASDPRAGLRESKSSFREYDDPGTYFTADPMDEKAPYRTIRYWNFESINQTTFAGMLFSINLFQQEGSQEQLLLVIAHVWQLLTDASSMVKSLGYSTCDYHLFAQSCCRVMSLISKSFFFLPQASKLRLHSCSLRIREFLYNADQYPACGLSMVTAEAENNPERLWLVHFHHAVRHHLLVWIDDGYFSEYAADLLLELLSMYERRPLATSLEVVKRSDGTYGSREDLIVSPVLALWMQLIHHADLRAGSASFWDLFLSTALVKEDCYTSAVQIPVESAWSILLFVCRLYLIGRSAGVCDLLIGSGALALWKCVESLIDSSLSPSDGAPPRSASRPFVIPPKAASNPSMYGRVLMERVSCIFVHWPAQTSVSVSITSQAFSSATDRQQEAERMVQKDALLPSADRIIKMLSELCGDTTSPRASRRILERLLSSFCLTSQASNRVPFLDSPNLCDDLRVCHMAAEMVVRTAKEAPTGLKRRRTVNEVLKGLSSNPRGTICVVLALQEESLFETVSAPVDSLCEAASAALNTNLSPDRHSILIVPAAAHLWIALSSSQSPDDVLAAAHKRLINCISRSMLRLADLLARVAVTDKAASKLNRISAALSCVCGSIHLITWSPTSHSKDPFGNLVPLLSPLATFVAHFEYLALPSQELLLSLIARLLAYSKAELLPGKSCAASPSPPAQPSHQQEEIILRVDDEFGSLGVDLDVLDSIEASFSSKTLASRYSQGDVVKYAQAMIAHLIPSLKALGDFVWLYRAHDVLVPKSEARWALDSTVLSIQANAMALVLSLAPLHPASESHAILESHMLSFRHQSKMRFAGAASAALGSCLIGPCFVFSLLQFASDYDVSSQEPVVPRVVRGHEWEFLEMWLLACLHPLTLIDRGPAMMGPSARIGRDLVGIARMLDTSYRNLGHELAGVFSSTPTQESRGASVTHVAEAAASTRHMVRQRGQLLWSVVVYMRRLWQIAKERAQAGRGAEAKSLKDRVLHLVRLPLSLMVQFFGQEWDWGPSERAAGANLRQNRELHAELCYSYVRMVARLLSESLKGPILIEMVTFLFDPVVRSSSGRVGTNEFTLAAGLSPWALRYIPDLIVCFSQLPYANPPIAFWIEALTEKSIRSGPNNSDNVHQWSILKSFASGLAGGGYAVKVEDEGALGFLDSTSLAVPSGVEFTSKLRQLRRSLLSRLQVVESLEAWSSSSDDLDRVQATPLIQRCLLFAQQLFISLSGTQSLESMLNEVDSFMLPLYTIMRKGLASSTAVAAFDASLRILELRSPTETLTSLAVSSSWPSQSGLASLRKVSGFASAIALCASIEIIHSKREVFCKFEELDELFMAISEAELSLGIVDFSGRKLPPDSSSELGSTFILSHSTIQSARRLSDLLAGKDEYFLASKWLTSALSSATPASVMVQ